MDSLGLLSFFATGFGLGLLHALDPDHVAAVGGLASGKAVAERKNVARFAVVWSAGHGGVLLSLAILVFLFGMAIPVRLSDAAEAWVPTLLIIIGFLGFWRIFRSFREAPNATKRDKNGAFWIGMIHGTAGSAPLLTLVSLTQFEQPYLGLAYVIFFGVGVTFAMAGFGNMLFYGFKYVQNVSLRNKNCLHALLSTFCLMLGIYLALNH